MVVPGVFWWLIAFAILAAARTRRDDPAGSAEWRADMARRGKEWALVVFLVTLAAMAGSVATSVVVVALYALTVGTVPPPASLGKIGLVIILCGEAASALIAGIVLWPRREALADWAGRLPRQAGRLFGRFKRESFDEQARAGLFRVLPWLAAGYVLAAAAFEVFVLCRLVFFHEYWEPILFLLVPGLTAALAVLAWVALRASRDRSFLGRCRRAWAAAAATFAAPDPGGPKPKPARVDRDFD